MTIKVVCVVGAICMATLIVTGDPAFAQSSWSSEEPQRSGRASSRDDHRGLTGESMRGNDEYRGPYVQFGATVGVIDYDGPIDTDAGGGFTLTGGYRATSWISAEANVTFVTGGDADVRGNDIGDAEFFSITIGPKFYPLGAFDVEAVPEFFQPYGLIGLGGGEFEIDANFGGDSEKSAFIARFIFGFDLWVTDHIGAFIEGGYHAAADDDVDGAGVFSLGAQYRF